ncbi:helix-turn-helix domain-containing protein [Streptomyces sp. NPDC004250]|uniref:AlbA family DNA-binding domain-containing protein n=1 Tax=Streptomyces sp. NPDC004250 TaxID=3364692 RepID=UPI0036876FB2
MSFTALHRALGLPPGPLTDEILTSAITAGVTETDDLDWKEELPPTKGLPQTDFPKDVAAMANSGGGIIVYGVRETQKAASKRLDVGELTETHERALRSAAVTAISPPVFGLRVTRIGDEGSRAVAVEVPASVDGPHLIYRNDYFGAPVRNDADTVWMKERQIEAMYRARFEERRHANEALDALYAEASAGRDSSNRAWLIGVAHPRIPRVQARMTREEAREVLKKAEPVALSLISRRYVHPLENVDRLNPRPGLRRWVAVNTAVSTHSSWGEAWASVHHDGSVTLAAAVGAHPSGRGWDAPGNSFAGWEVQTTAIECGVADLLAMLRTTAQVTGVDEYDVRVGIEWKGDHPMLTLDTMGFIYRDVSTPLHTFTPVETTVNGQAAEDDFAGRVYEIAQDCVNQGGISNLLLIKPAVERGDAEQ